MRDDILRVFHKWLWIEDEVPLDIIVSTALASMFPGDPIWILVIGPPGCGKTEIVRALSGEWVYSIDSITSKTLISGLKEKGKETKFGIIQDLHEKLLVIKDLTVMLQSNPYAKSEDNIFSQLRAAYDGEYASAHGAGHKRQYYKARFGLIAAVTPIVDRYRSLNTSLGERFLSIRISQDSIRAIEKAQENCGREETMRLELQQVLAESFRQYKELGKSVGLEPLNFDDALRIRALGNILAKMRSEVVRDKLRHPVAIPETEVGTRVVKQLTRLAEVLNLYGAYNYQNLTRVTRDSITPLKLRVIRALYEMFRANPWELHHKTGLPYPTVREVCEDLYLLKICDKEERGRTGYYTFNSESIELIIISEMFE